MSKLIEGLVQFMARLDYEGLHYDEAEAREALEPVEQLEAKIERLQKVERQARNVADMAQIAFDGWAIAKEEQPRMVALFGALAALHRRLEQALRDE